MPQPPTHPKIYHIVHVDRLLSIIRDGCLWSDAMMEQKVRPGTTIGMGAIKKRRLTLPVRCHEGDRVGEYVPFYFCPRSVMLYVIHCANNPELGYRGGQGPIVHLAANLYEVIAWADANHRRWAFSLSNASAGYTEFRSSVSHLSEVNWPAVAATDFRSADTRGWKQAEFLVHQNFPWQLVRRIGVSEHSVAQQVANAMHGADHRPQTEIRSEWYF